MGPGVGPADADVMQAAVVAQGDDSGVVDAVGPDPVVGVGGAVAWGGFGAGCVAVFLPGAQAAQFGFQAVLSLVVGSRGAGRPGSRSCSLRGEERIARRPGQLLLVRSGYRAADRYGLN